MDIIEGDFKARARCVFNNIKGIAEESGANLNNIVKITIYLTDLANFASVNEVMLEYFDSPFPARAAVQVSALPKDVDIEADAIVAHDNL
jgi:reactive intermediate/imine deaminase